VKKKEVGFKIERSMKMRNIALIIFTFSVFCVLGCCDHEDNGTAKNPEVTIIVRPISPAKVAGEETGTGDEGLAVLVEYEGNILICYSQNHHPLIDYLAAAALIDGVRLGDDVNVAFKGKYEDDRRFKIYEVEAYV